MTYRGGLSLFRSRHLHLVLNLALKRITASYGCVRESTTKIIKLFMLQVQMVRARLPHIFPTHCLQVDYGWGDLHRLTFNPIRSVFKLMMDNINRGSLWKIN